MKVLLVIDQFNQGNNGTTISCNRLCEYLVKHGNEVSILTVSKPGKNIYTLPERYIPIATELAHKQGLLFAKPVKSTMIEAIQSCDVVHFLMPWKLAKTGIKLAKKLNKPFTAAFHVQPENITYNIGMGKAALINKLVYYYFKYSFYNQVSHIHCPSNFIAGELRRNHYKGKLHIISNGVDKKFVPLPNPEDKVPSDKFIITMVGRLSSEKRQDVLMEAVAKSKYRDKIQLVFAGKGPKSEQYKAMGQKLPNKPIFGFYAQSDLVKLLQQSDLYVHSADVEIEAISCLEALACGLVPIISNSPISATKQFALNEKSLFKKADSTDLAAKIDYWIEHPEEKAEMSKQYREYSQNFLLENCLHDMVNMFSESIQEHEMRGN